MDYAADFDLPDDFDELRSESRRLGIKNAKRGALFVAVLATGLPAYAAAQIAGYSSGSTTDPDKIRKNLSAQAARTRKSTKIRRLLSWYLNQRQNNGAEILESAEVLALISSEAKNATGTARLQALKLLSDYHAKREPHVFVGKPLRSYVDALCQRPNLLMQCIGVLAGEQWRRGGDPSLRDWRPPADLQHLADMMQTISDPADILETFFSISRGVGNGYTNDDGSKQQATGSSIDQFASGSRGTARSSDGASVPIDERPRTVVIAGRGS